MVEHKKTIRLDRYIPSQKEECIDTKDSMGINALVVLNGGKVRLVYYSSDTGDLRPKLLRDREDVLQEKNVAMMRI